MPTNISVPERLLRLLNFHENAAATVRATITLLQRMDNKKIILDPPSSNGSNGTSHSIPTVAKRAMQMDANRRAAKPDYPGKPGPKAKPTKRAKSQRKNVILRQRRQSADLLATFDKSDPRLLSEFTNSKIKPTAFAPLVRRGYLTRKGGGYVRTEKVFSVHPE
jgi:hypothetical protein